MLTQGVLKFHMMMMSKHIGALLIVSEIFDVYHFRLAGVNKRAAATAGLLPIANCELVIVHTQPGDVTTIRGKAVHRTQSIFVLSVISALIFRQVQLTRCWRSLPTSPPCYTPRQQAQPSLTSCSISASSITGWILMLREICQAEEIWLKA